MPENHLSDNINPSLEPEKQGAHKIQKKILYWGMFSSGKTTIVDTLHKLTQELDLDIKPDGDLTKIQRESGATLYFDRGIFQSQKFREVSYHIFTVAGQKSFGPLRKKIFKGTDGVIFVFDSQTHLLEDNIEFLKELKGITGGSLIKEIPLIIMANKQDLTNIVSKEEIKSILKNENLWFDQYNSLNIWNPIIYETCALYDHRKDVYRSFSECARRIGLYELYGNGKAPVNDKFLSFARKNLLL